MTLISFISYRQAHHLFQTDGRHLPPSRQRPAEARGDHKEAAGRGGGGGDGDEVSGVFYFVHWLLVDNVWG